MVDMMKRVALREALLAREIKGDSSEADYRTRMLDLLKTEPRCFYRDCFPAHFTGSALVVSSDGSKTLLTHHRILNKWLQFGGHCDGEEDVLKAACREALEESGIKGLIVASQSPFDLDIHTIPRNQQKNEPTHQHYDLRYVLIAPEGSKPKVSDESHELRWFTPQEVLKLRIDDGMRRLVGKWVNLLQRRMPPR